MIAGVAGPTCVICGARSTGPLSAQPVDYEYSVQPARSLTVYLCHGCGSRFVHPRPTVEEMLSFYPSNYHAYHEDHGSVAGVLVARRSKARAGGYRRLVGKDPIRLFDVGTGDCRHFQDLSRYGRFEFAGVELNPGMVEAARRRGYDVQQGTLEELDTCAYQGRFDLVTMYQLVEHVGDPRLLFDKALALLKPGGYVLGQLPCMDSLERRIFGRYWAGYHYPRHLQMFSKRGMRGLLEAAGFGEVSVSTALHLQAGLSLQNLLLGKMGYRPRMVYGKTPAYSLLLLAVTPFCAIEFLFRQGGMMNFRARRRRKGGSP